ncbi:MAG: ribonuclease P protein component [Rhodanobacteraceae bacterium]
MPPAARLRRAADFAALRRASGRWQGAYFLLRWMASSAPHARLGLAVSRRVNRRAVVRNRIKRVIRESFRMQRANLPPLDVLVIAKPSAAGSDSAALTIELERAWRTLAALKRSSAPVTIEGCCSGAPPRHEFPR